MSQNILIFSIIFNILTQYYLILKFRKDLEISINLKNTYMHIYIYALKKIKNYTWIFFLNFQHSEKLL